MERLNALDWLAFILVIVGSLFWGLVGIVGVPILEGLALLTPTVFILFRVVWLLVGLSGLWVIWSLYKMIVPAMKERITPAG